MTSDLWNKARTFKKERSPSATTKPGGYEPRSMVSFLALRYVIRDARLSVFHPLTVSNSVSVWSDSPILNRIEEYISRVVASPTARPAKHRPEYDLRRFSL